MKKLVSAITCAMFLLILAISPQAAEPLAVPDGYAMASEDLISPKATDYFSGSTVKMNSLNGSKSTISTISSGSVIGKNPKITSVSLNVTVSTGSDPFKLYVEAPSGIYDYANVSKSRAVNFSSFNGINPSGKWKVYIVTDDFVSTATARMRVNYSY